MNTNQVERAKPVYFCHVPEFSEKDYERIGGSLHHILAELEVLRALGILNKVTA